MTLTVRHRDGVPWDQAPLPRRFHHCTPWTTGVTVASYVERCACGAIRGRFLSDYGTRGGWRWAERNTRRRR